MVPGCWEPWGKILAPLSASTIEESWISLARWGTSMFRGLYLVTGLSYHNTNSVNIRLKNLFNSSLSTGNFFNILVLNDVHEVVVKAVEKFPANTKLQTAGLSCLALLSK